MTQAWMPGADRLGAAPARTARGIGAPRAVWTVTGSDPGARSAHEEARRLVDEGDAVHLVWNPLTGEVVQSLPATRRSQLLLGTTNRYSQYVDHGEEGRVCLVVAVVARAEPPFTDGPMRGLAPIMHWMDVWGVARRWPSEPPGLGGAGGVSGAEVARVWAGGGHFGHDQVPGSLSAGPGRLDSTLLLRTVPTAGANDGPPTSPHAPPTAAPLHTEQQPSAIT